MYVCVSVFICLHICVRNQKPDLHCCFSQRFLPLEENGEVMGEQPHQTEALKIVSEEHKDVVEVCNVMVSSLSVRVNTHHMDHEHVY